MDDQAETVLLNLLRGAGADGLAGHGAGVPAPAARPAPAPRPTRCAPRRASCRCATPATTTRPSCATASATSSCPCARRWPAATRSRCWPGRPACCATRWRCSTSLAADALPDPADARAVAPGRAAAGRAAPCARWLRETGGADHPPSLAEVDRALAVARGDAVGTELAGGGGCAARGGRLRVEPGRSGSVTPVTQTRPERASRPGPSPTSAPSWWTPERLAARVAELGAQITADYADEPPLLVAVLKGAMLFMSDLCRAIELPVDVDFMAVSSYGSATKTSGVVRIVKDLDSELEGRHVLVVEDIIDSGLTLNYLRRYLQRPPAQERGGVRPARQGGRAAGRPRPALRRVHASRPSSSSATGSTWPSATATSRGVHRYKGVQIQ